MESQMEVLNILHDTKSSCSSIITNISLGDYLNLIETAYANDGALEGQRKAQTSKSAVRIRHQMMSDFLDGGVLPPVVVGLIEPELSEETKNVRKDQLLKHLFDRKEQLCIIDGMQRTTAMREAVRDSVNTEISERQIRIEVWMSKSVTKLIYRMLVLNTGQLPWSLRRQLEVVMLPIKNELSTGISELKIMEANDASRRTRPGEFQADKLLELFLIFGSRSEKVDTRDLISEEFLKLDFIESASKGELLSDYIEILKLVISFDYALAGLKPSEDSQRFDKGIDLFTSQPVLAGLICALAMKIYGRPGADYEIERQRRNFDKIVSGFNKFLEKISSFDESELAKFMRFETLNSILGTKSSASTKIGDMERAYFRDAFLALISEDFDVDSMEICWRA